MGRFGYRNSSVETRLSTGNARFGWVSAVQAEVYRLLCIALVLPVTSAASDRSFFSALKLIKVISEVAYVKQPA